MAIAAIASFEYDALRTPRSGDRTPADRAINLHQPIAGRSSLFSSILMRPASRSACAVQLDIIEAQKEAPGKGHALWGSRCGATEQHVCIATWLYGAGRLCLLIDGLQPNSLPAEVALTMSCSGWPATNFVTKVRDGLSARSLRDQQNVWSSAHHDSVPSGDQIRTSRTMFCSKSVEGR